MLKSRLSALSLIALCLVSWPIAPVSGGEPKSQTFDAKGIKIHFLIEGKGEPVILIHGLY